MPPNFPDRLQNLAEIIVRVGLNLQPGQRLLIAEPYELQGVAREAEGLVEAIHRAAGTEIEVIWGDGARLRDYALNKDWRGFVPLVRAHARRMQEYIQNQDALLFLQSSQPGLLAGLPAGDVAELRRLGWEHFGPVAQQLVQGATNWTVAPAPIPAWARAVYPGLSPDEQSKCLWQDVFAALRATEPAPLTAWTEHLQRLQHHCDDLNARRLPFLRYRGDGTDLKVILPPEHVWCTARLTTKAGRPFVANLPTEEVFTAPHRDGVDGTLRISRPISYGGGTIEDIELEFKRGRVISARAGTGADLLQQLLATDEGADRLGEVAVVPGPNPLRRSPRLFHHPLLDENASPHVALGEAYGFCLQSPNPTARNRSLIHVDLPFTARLILPGEEPAG